MPTTPEQLAQGFRFGSQLVGVVGNLPSLPAELGAGAKAAGLALELAAELIEEGGSPAQALTAALAELRRARAGLAEIEARERAKVAELAKAELGRAKTDPPKSSDHYDE